MLLIWIFIAYMHADYFTFTRKVGVRTPLSKSNDPLNPPTTNIDFLLKLFLT
jgi:hypothetical protein